MSGDVNFERLRDREKMTDIELSLRFYQLIDVQYSGENIYIGMAENALRTMTNPFARKLLMDKIAEHHGVQTQ